jgi:sec-independent protein translocase protein TatA
MGLFDFKHWIVILVVVVLVFGTRKLKTLGSDVGETIKGFRKAVNEDSDAVAQGDGGIALNKANAADEPQARH